VKHSNAALENYLHWIKEGIFHQCKRPTASGPIW